MPDFRTEAELKNYILNHSRNAVFVAGQQVKQIVEKNLKQFYNEFEPDQYIRTEKLMKSLIDNGLKYSGNGWDYEVYFDSSTMNYETGSWDGDKVLRMAAHGSHGGYVQGTGVFYDSDMEVFQRHVDILKSALIQAGIPVV